MSLQFLAKKLEGQSLREEDRLTSQQKDGEGGDDSGTESDDERGDEKTEEEVSYTGRRFELRKTIFRHVCESGSSSSKSPGASLEAPTNQRGTCDMDDNYSSEEELKEIISETKKSAGLCFSAANNSTSSAGPEKRKWSEIETSDSEGSEEVQSPAFVIRPVSSSSSSLECDDKYTLGVATPVQFRSSPPLDVHRPRQSQSPPPKFFHLSASSPSPIPTLNTSIATSDDQPQQQQQSGLHSVSDITSLSGDKPKRHHRRHSGDSRNHSPSKRHRSTPRPHNIQRPCLDFEKMQQIKKRVVTSWRPKGTELSLFCW